MRFVRTLISLGFLLFGAAVLVLAVGSYLTASGRSVPVMRTAVTKVGNLMVGQTIGQVAVSVSIEPSAGHVDGVARLLVRADQPRRRLYLLLDDGFSIRHVWQVSSDGQRAPLSHYRLWLLSAIDLGRSLDAGEEVSLEIAYEGSPMAGVSPFGQSVVGSDEIILTPTDLWYPTDLKSFFRADVEVTLPKSMALVHSGTGEVSYDLGSSRRVRWTTARPVNGLSLVAGRFRGRAIENAGTVHRAFLGEGVDLDVEKILASMTEAFIDFGEAYGASGASRQAVFVSRRLRRSFADGAGVVGLTPSSFRGGDYGFAAIADGVARTWWGGTVAANPLEPDAAGGWVMEGFAGNAARIAVRRRFGADAEFRWRTSRFFDPTATGKLAELSWLDRELEPDRADDLYDKAAYVAMMLQARIGDAAFRESAREVVERFRGKTVSSVDLQRTFNESTGLDLEPMLTPWIESVGQVDLSLDPKQGGAVVANHQAIAASPEVELWRVPPGGQPLEQTIAVGDTTPLGNAERIVVDPRGLLADMYRSNNVLPREDGPRSVSRSVRGQWMVVQGEPHRWAPARIEVIDAQGRALHAWNFDLGLEGEPSWSADGTHILAAEPPTGGSPTLYALHPSDGSMIDIGEDTAVSGGAESYVAARRGRLVEVAGKRSREIARVDDGRIGNPLLSPDGAYVAFTSRRGGEMEIAVRSVAVAASPRALMTWPSGVVRWRWSPDSKRLFAVLSGDWDWQLWEIPLEGNPRALMGEAAGVRSLAISADGNRIALAAQAELDYRSDRHEVFLIDRTNPGGAQRYTVSGKNVVDLSWLDGETLLVVVTDSTYPIVPAQREIVKLRLTDGSVLPFP